MISKILEKFFGYIDIVCEGISNLVIEKPKRKKTKSEKKAASFQNPKKEYYKFATPKSWLAKLKKKQKKLLA